jgi:5-dehydro-4-deoxyglucarate dehydratase
LFDDGVLFFPLTPFDAHDRVDLRVLGEHLERSIEHNPAGVFPACGAGELHALSAEEHIAVTERAVQVVGGRAPVFVGAGGPLPTAIAMCQTAGGAGADGVLLLPPYLVSAPQAGLAAYIRRVAEASPLPVVLYARANARLSPETAADVAELPNVIGIKDGVGDISLMQRIVLSVRDRVPGEFLFLNGLPTAELSAQAYRGIGVPGYSSAVFAFAPEIANAFRRSLDTPGSPLTASLLADFYHPLVQLRDEVTGYAVAMGKAGASLRGLSVGSVRPPLLDLTDEHRERLRGLIERGLGLVAQETGAIRT